MPSCMRAPPEAREDDRRALALERALEHAGDLLADHRAHRAAHELEDEERPARPATLDGPAPRVSASLPPAVRRAARRRSP